MEIRTAEYRCGLDSRHEMSEQQTKEKPEIVSRITNAKSEIVSRAMNETIPMVSGVMNETSGIASRIINIERKKIKKGKCGTVFVE